MSKTNCKEIGKQLGVFLKKLHGVKNINSNFCSLEMEIKAWQSRVKDVESFINKTFSSEEQKILNKLIFEYMPHKLKSLGENLVYSHGDLGDGNIFIDDNYHVGVIDFNESGLLDEAADFMDISDNMIVNEMLISYGANNSLKEKVNLRRDIRPIIVLKPYLTRNNPDVIDNLVKLIRKSLTKYKILLNETIAYKE